MGSIDIRDIGGGDRFTVEFNPHDETGRHLIQTFGMTAVVVFDETKSCMLCGTKGAYVFVDGDGGFRLCFEHLNKVDWFKKVD